MVTIKLKPELTEIQRVTVELETFAEAQGLNERDVFQFSLCLDELLTNTIHYGYSDNVDQHQDCDIWVSFDRVDDRVLVILEDNGQAFNPIQEADQPDLHADLEARPIGGLGLHFVKKFMDACRYARINDRNRLELEKRMTPVQA